MSNENPMTVDEMIKILQHVQKEGNGKLKILHSFNTIHDISEEKIYNENFIVLKGWSNES